MNARRKRAAAAAAAIGAAALAVLVGLYHGGESAAAAQYGPADFTVETTADAPDLSPGDGVCATAVGDNNACTLRAAIQEANAIAGANTIHVPAGTYTLSIAGPGERAAATGDLDITDDVTIDGAGAAATIVDGGGLDRVFNNSTAIDLTNCSGPTTTISGLTVRNGNTQPADATVGGGIFNCGTLDLTDVVLTGNFAGDGGAVFNEGELTVSSSHIDRNTAGSHSGGIFNNQGTLTIRDSSVSGNVAQVAGGIGNWPGSTLTLTDSIVRGNKADAGGGLANFKGFGSVTVATVTGTTFTGNEALGPDFGNGGAVDSSATLTITSSTISGNHAVGIGGGIVYGGDVTVTNSTITDNVADADNGGGGLFVDQGGTLKNTIVAGNRAAGNPSNCAGAKPTSGGHNLEDTNSCGFGAPGDLLNTNPTLGLLQDNGGPTFTQALLAGSPAIDAGDNSGCPSTDQRGQPRPVDGDSDGTAVCDIGGYEAAAPASGVGPPVITPDVSGTAGLNGWYRSDVAISWSVQSAVSTSGCEQRIVNVDTPGMTFTCSATSPGGSTATTSVTIRRDTAPPNLTCTATPDRLWPANHKLVPVTTSVSVADALSGPAGFTLVSATSTEGDPASDVQGWTLGDADTSGFLRAERSRADGGRTYTLTYQGTDVAGNSATCDVALTVPLHKSKT